jgi:mannose-6-phosphate isomerase-like protein (cupin superfamily)
MTTTPLVTTIHDISSSAVLPLYKKYNGQVFYVATNDADRHPELDYIATIDHGVGQGGFSAERMVEDYLRVYEKILAQRHREDHRPWGYYLVLEDELDHKVKRIVVYPGARLSLQRHQHRAEHWLIVQGRAEITRNDETMNLESGQSIDIPQGAWHRIRNPGTENMAFIEVQTGDYFGEDDIERKQNDYNRL